MFRLAGEAGEVTFWVSPKSPFLNSLNFAFEYTISRRDLFTLKSQRRSILMTIIIVGYNKWSNSRVELCENLIILFVYCCGSKWYYFLILRYRHGQFIYHLNNLSVLIYLLSKIFLGIRGLYMYGFSWLQNRRHLSLGAHYFSLLFLY